MEVLLAIPFGLAIGAVVGTVGGGGAILALPVLVYALDQGVSSATTASLIVVALAASVGAGSQARDGQVCWRVALIVLRSSRRRRLCRHRGQRRGQRAGLILAFVPVMLTAAVLTYRRGDDPGSAEVSVRLPEAEHRPSRRRRLVVGWMTGFFGVGGGFLIVPALTILLGLGMRRAIATSLAIITLTGAVALISHLARALSRTGR